MRYINKIGILLASALLCSSCSDIADQADGFSLSGKKIAFVANLQDGWQSSGSKSRAASECYGVAREQKVLPLSGDICKPLYLHPLEVETSTTIDTVKLPSSFAPSVASRGKMIEGTSFTGDFGVNAVYVNNNTTQSFFQNEQASKMGTSWFPNSGKQWPSDGSLSFFAYAPYGDSSLSLQGSDDVVKDKTIRYVASSSDIDSQPDLIVANTGKLTHTSSAVALNFSHALTAVTFSVSADMVPGTVKSITVKGVAGQGDYNMETATWSGLSATGTNYQLSLGADDSGITVKAGEGKVLTDASAALMMIPQSLGSNAQIEVVFNDGNQDRMVSASLSGTKWEAGKHITYVLSSSSISTLQLGDITFPTNWSNKYSSAAHPIKSAYTNGDEMGLFVVDENKKVVAANEAIRYDGSQWSLNSNAKAKFSPSYSYFVYYPYQAGGLSGAPSEGDAVSDAQLASAKGFFASAMNEWGNSLPSNQATLAEMNACDLQIGKGKFDETSGVKFSFPDMLHAMGLADVTLGSIRKGVEYYLKDYEEYTWEDVTTLYATSSLSGHNPYLVDAHKILLIVPADKSTILSSGTALNGELDWSDKVTLSPSFNDIDAKQAKVNSLLTRMQYQMHVGDIYYSDGGMTHQEDNLRDGKTPVGIVGYVGDNYWTETQLKSSSKGGHALVMCLKTIGSTGTTSIGTGYAWYSSNTDAGRTKINSKALITGSYNQTYGSGVTETTALITKWSTAADAAYQAKNYTTLPASSSKCSGWFLPTAGQYYAVMSTLGAAFSSDWTGIYGDAASGSTLGFFSNMTNVTGNINNKLKKVGNNNYTEFFGATCTWAWTSSEFSAMSAVYLTSGINNSKGAGSVRFCNSFAYGKKDEAPVRPFLAF